MTESTTKDVSTDEIGSDEQPPIHLTQRVEELEEMVYDLQQQVEELERDSMEQQMRQQFDGGF